MKTAFLICALGLWQPLFFAPYTPHFEKNHLTRDDLDVFHHLMDYDNPRNGNRILLVGYQEGWIKQLRQEGWFAYGVTTREVYKAYWFKVEDYAHIDFRTAYFRTICLFEPLNLSALIEVDRLLVPHGFLAIEPNETPLQRSVFAPYYTYGDFLHYLHYVRMGMALRGMSIWHKRNLQESA